eukprot:1994442-Pleurochrysis_carterae.AAC.1
MSSLFEQLLRAIMCGKIPETNLQLHRALAYNEVSTEFNQQILSDSGFTVSDHARPTPMPAFLRVQM